MIFWECLYQHAQIGKLFLFILTENVDKKYILSLSLWAYPSCHLKHRRFVLAQGFNWRNRRVGSSCHLCSLCSGLKYSLIFLHTRQQVADQRPQPWRQGRSQEPCLFITVLTHLCSATVLTPCHSLFLFFFRMFCIMFANNALETVTGNPYRAGQASWGG